MFYLLLHHLTLHLGGFLFLGIGFPVMFWALFGYVIPF